MRNMLVGNNVDQFRDSFVRSRMPTVPDLAPHQVEVVDEDAGEGGGGNSDHVRDGDGDGNMAIPSA